MLTAGTDQLFKIDPAARKAGEEAIAKECPVCEQVHQLFHQWSFFRQGRAPELELVDPRKPLDLRLEFPVLGNGKKSPDTSASLVFHLGSTIEEA